MEIASKGQNITTTPESANPVPATGQKLNSTSNASITVEAGVYILSAVVGYVLLGLLTQATDANVMYVAVAGGPSAHVYVPEGTTALNYICVGSSPIAYLRKVWE